MKNFRLAGLLHRCAVVKQPTSSQMTQLRLLYAVGISTMATKKLNQTYGSSNW